MHTIMKARVRVAKTKSVAGRLIPAYFKPGCINPNEKISKRKSLSSQMFTMSW